MDRTLACEAGNLGSTPNEDTTLSVVIGTLSVPQANVPKKQLYYLVVFL